MPFDLNKIPFYKAVALFEAEKYQEAFDIFADCALKGNLYAPFYLDYILKEKHLQDKIKIQDKHGAFVKSLQEYLKNIPKAKRPEAWCKTSVFLIKLNKKEDIEKNIIRELKGLYPYAPNAAIFLLNYNLKRRKHQPNIEILTSILTKADLYLHFHLVKNIQIIAITGIEAQMQQLQAEWKELESFQESLVYSHGANVERLFSLYYAGAGGCTGIAQGQKRLLKSSPFKRDIQRQYLWQLCAAHHGNKELQFVFSQASPHVSMSKAQSAVCTPEEQFRWKYIAAYNNEPQACIDYGIACRNLGNNREARIFLEKGLAVANIDKVTQRLRGMGLLVLGRILEAGTSDGKEDADDAAALNCYLEAEKLGNAVAVSNIGTFYEEGRGGLEKNYQKAVLQFQKAIEIGVDQINEKYLQSYHESIANLYFKGGFGIEKDLKQVREHCRLAYPSQLWSQETYGRMLFLGVAGEEDVKKGVELMVQAADKGMARAAYTIVKYYLAEQIPNPLEFGITEAKIIQYLESALELSTKAFSLDHEEQPHSLRGMFYLKYAKKPDYKKASESLRLGAQKKETYSLLALGQAYEQGSPELGISIDHKQAYEYYHEASELGSPQGLSNKAFLLFNGFGCKKDTALAKQCYEAALAQGCKSAAYGLGCMYGRGDGVEKDHKREFEYYKMAEELNDADVFYSLGLCYEKGRGVERDLKLAFHYYELAIKQEHTWAVRNYALLKINAGIQSGSISIDTLQDLLNKLQIGVKKGLAGEIFLHALVQLWLNPSDVKAVIEDLKISIQQKPFKKSQMTIEYLTYQCERGKPITLTDVALLFTQQDPLATFKKMEAEGILVPEADNTPKPLLLSKTLESVKTKTKTKTKTKLEKLQEKVEWFTDPQNIKCINFTEFKRLMGEVSVLQELELEMLPSKGSNTRFHLSNADQNKTLCFSYHPTHRRGQGMDSSFDPRRARSLQTAMKSAAAASI